MMSVGVIVGDLDGDDEREPASRETSSGEPVSESPPGASMNICPSFDIAFLGTLYASATDWGTTRRWWYERKSQAAAILKLFSPPHKRLEAIRCIRCQAL